jgi:hypothetical protein
MRRVNRFLNGAGVHQPDQGSRGGGVLPQYSDRARAQHLGTQVKVLHGERTSRRGPDDKQTSLYGPDDKQTSLCGPDDKQTSLNELVQHSAVEV